MVPPSTEIARRRGSPSFLQKQESRGPGPQRLLWTLAFARVTSGPLVSLSDLADAWQHLVGEEFERAHQTPGVGSAWVLEGEVENADTDLLAAALDLLDDRVGAAEERGRQYAADGRGPRLARDIARVEFSEVVAN